MGLLEFPSKQDSSNMRDAWDSRNLRDCGDFHLNKFPGTLGMLEILGI
jgi:hypothetical protein